MRKRFGIVFLFVGLAVAPIYLLAPRTAQAQQDEVQRAYNTGYQNGVNAARRNQPMNMNTDDWHGDRLTAYQKGYREGYESSGYRGDGDHDHDRDHHNYTDPEAQRAFQTGYQN